MLLNCGVGEDSWESLGLQGDPTSQSWRKSLLNIHWKNWCWAEAPILWPPDVKGWLKTLMLGKIEVRSKRGWQDEMVVWHQQLNGHEFEQALGDSERQGSLACCSPWGRKESDITDWVINNSGWRFITFYRRRWSKPFPRKRNATRQNGCLRSPYK